MEINYRKFGRKKMAAIWLTNEEQNTKTDELKALTDKLKAENYLIVIYRSGSKDLATYTKGLIKQNLAT